MLTIQEGANKIARMCMGVKAGESVVIITDLSRPASLGSALQKACMDLGAEAVLITIDSHLVNGQLPDSVGRAICFADVLFCVTANTLGYTKAVDACKKNGCRVAAITDVLEDAFMKGSIEVNYEAMAPVIAGVEKAFNEASHVQITAPGGTSITLSIQGRKAFTCPGVLHAPGGLIGLPGMEVYIAPVEDQTNGILVADASGSGLGKLEDPVRISIEAGRAYDISGGKQAKMLADRLKATNNPNSYVIAEFAIGLNPFAELVGHIAIDEGIYGTGHFALGNNLGFAGKNDAPQHFDMVYWKPTIYLDEKLFMKDGRLVELDHLIPKA